MKQERINVAEILKHCPKGMELDCISYNGVVTLGGVTNNIYYPISINVSCNNENICVILTEYGQTAPTMFNKCVIFPKGKTTWEGFIPPCKFKAGDVLVSQVGNIVLFSHIDSYNCVKYHCIIPTYGSFRIEEKTSTGVGRYYDCVLANEQQRQKMYNQIKCSGYKYNQQFNKLEKLNEPEPKFKEGDILYTVTGEGRYYLCIVDCIIGGILYTKASCSCSGHFLCTCEEQIDMDKLTTARLATEEEKQKLFDAIKINGYKWNEKTKTLEKLIVPKLKVGDVIQDKKDSYKVKITDISVEDETYGYESVVTGGIGGIGFDKQDEWELVPNKFDINTLVPFESRVLVRDTEEDIWKPAVFGCCIVIGKIVSYYVLGGTRWAYCIPYEGNQHLIGKTDDCDEYFKTWE